MFNFHGMSANIHVVDSTRLYGLFLRQYLEGTSHCPVNLLPTKMSQQGAVFVGKCNILDQSVCVLPYFQGKFCVG